MLNALENNLLYKIVKKVKEKYNEANFKRSLFCYAGSPVSIINIKDINKIDAEEMFDRILLNTKGEYQIVSIRYKRDNFGFSEGYPTYCPEYNLKGNTEGYSLETLCGTNKFFICSYENEKGRKAKWFCALRDLNEKFQEWLEPYVLEALISSALKIEQEKFYKKREEEKEKLLESLGGTYQQVVIDERDSYGGKKEYKFLFSNPVDKETFVKFLNLKGLVTEAHKIDAPICQETVEFYPIVGGWRYKWLGSYTD